MPTTVYPDCPCCPESGSGSGSGCAIPGWHGSGWYCIDNGLGVCVPAELLAEDECDHSIVICSGPYPTEEAAQAVCAVQPDCCDGNIPDDIYFHVTAGPGCEDANGLVIHVHKDPAPATTWSLVDTTGGIGTCGSQVSSAELNCVTGRMLINWGVDNNADVVTPNTWTCSPFSATYNDVPVNFIEDLTCCVGTISVLVNGTP